MRCNIMQWSERITANAVLPNDALAEYLHDYNKICFEIIILYRRLLLALRERALSFVFIKFESQLVVHTCITSGTRTVNAYYV